MSAPLDPGFDLDFGLTLRGFAAGQRLFDRYALKEILGRGGMGIVWRAFDEELERDVALKFLPELIAFDETAIADLKRETKKSQELRHHHIVQVYDFVSDKQSACISMEYVDGPTLSAVKARKEQGFLEVAEIKGWIEQLCEALAYAHRRARVVHRDLKPANLMINSKGELKVADFGIARSVSDSASMLTMARGTSGTLVYMSPQQLRGERPSHSDDIYSIGVSIYELLTGKPPFYSGDVTDQIKNATPISLQQRRHDLDIHGERIPPEWEQTVAASLAKDSDLRPQSAGDVAKRLGLAVPWYESIGLDKAAQSAARPPDKRDIPARKQFLQSKRGLLMAAGLVLLIAGGCLAGWWFGVEQPKRRAESERLTQRSAAERAAQEQTDKERSAAKATAEKKESEEKVKAAAAAQAAEEKRKPEQAAAEEEKKRGEAAKNIANATKEHPYENSLGMKFAPVRGTSVLFSVWQTRAKDFQAFVDATGFKAEGGMYSLEKGGWRQAGRTWRNPGFEQTGDHSVCGVSWDDAKAFCDWLTREERKAGRISDQQSYRLPTDLEWSAAVGLEKENGSTPEERYMKVKGIYPWGTQWPPPKGAGNYAGSEARTGAWPTSWETIKGYRDEYPRTSPVGSFRANESGIYDLGGNVSEWCEDWWNAEKKDRVRRGASWCSNSPDDLLSSYRMYSKPDDRVDSDGFRCVLAENSAESQTTLQDAPQSLPANSLKDTPKETGPAKESTRASIPANVKKLLGSYPAFKANTGGELIVEFVDAKTVSIRGSCHEYNPNGYTQDCSFKATVPIEKLTSNNFRAIIHGKFVTQFLDNQRRDSMTVATLTRDSGGGWEVAVEGKQPYVQIKRFYQVFRR